MVGETLKGNWITDKSQLDKSAKNQCSIDSKETAVHNDTLNLCVKNWKRARLQTLNMKEEYLLIDVVFAINMS